MVLRRVRKRCACAICTAPRRARAALGYAGLMTTSATTLSKNGKKWIVGVRDKLSRRDGFQLLKILYHKDNEIQEGELDRAGNVYQVYTLSKNSTKDDGGAVALLYYRLTLLVPHSVAPPDGQSALDPDKLLTAKDLGAQDCLDYYEKCGLSRPGEPSVSPEARLPECFVMAYVTLSPPRRQHFKEQLSIAVGVYREKQLDLFNLFCRLSHGSSETTVDTFISALNNAEVPPMIFEQLQHQLDSHCIQHNPIDIGMAGPCVI